MYRLYYSLLIVLSSTINAMDNKVIQVKPEQFNKKEVGINEKERDIKISNLVELFNQWSAEIKQEELLQTSHIENLIIKLIDLEAWDKLDTIACDLAKKFSITSDMITRVSKLKIGNKIKTSIWQTLLLKYAPQEEFIKFYQQNITELVNAQAWSLVENLVNLYPKIDEQLIIEAIGLDIKSEKNKLIFISYLLVYAPDLRFSLEFFQTDQAKELIKLYVKYDCINEIQDLVKRGFVVHSEDMFLPMTWEDVSRDRVARWTEFLNRCAEKQGVLFMSNGNCIYKPVFVELITNLIKNHRIVLLKSVVEVSLSEIDEKTWNEYSKVLSAMKDFSSKSGIVLSCEEAENAINTLIDTGYVSLVAFAYNAWNITISSPMILSNVNAKNRSLEHKELWLKSIFAIQNEMIKRNFCSFIDCKRYSAGLSYALLNGYDKITNVILEQMSALKNNYDEKIKDLGDKKDRLDTKDKKREELMVELIKLSRLRDGVLYASLHAIIFYDLEENGKKKIKLDSEGHKVKLIEKTIELFKKYNLGDLESMSASCRLSLVIKAAASGYHKIFDDLRSNKEIDFFSVDEEGNNIIAHLIDDDEYKEDQILKIIDFMQKKIDKHDDLLKLISPAPFERNPLCLAAQHGYWLVVEQLLKLGANPCTLDHKSHNLLHKIVTDKIDRDDDIDRRKKRLIDNEKIKWIKRLTKLVGPERINDLLQPNDGKNLLLYAVSTKSSGIFKELIKSGASLHQTRDYENILVCILEGEGASDRKIEFMKFVLDNSSDKDNNLFYFSGTVINPFIKALMQERRIEAEWLLNQTTLNGMKEASAMICSLPAKLIDNCWLDETYDSIEILLKKMIEVAKKCNLFDDIFNKEKEEANLIYLIYTQRFFITTHKNLTALLLKNGVMPRLYCDADYLKYIAESWADVYKKDKLELSSLNNQKLWAFMSIVFDKKLCNALKKNLKEHGINVPADTNKTKEDIFKGWAQALPDLEYDPVGTCVTGFLNSNYIDVDKKLYSVVEDKFTEWLEKKKKLEQKVEFKDQVKDINTDDDKIVTKNLNVTESSDNLNVLQESELKSIDQSDKIIEYNESMKDDLSLIHEVEMNITPTETLDNKKAKMSLLKQSDHFDEIEFQRTWSVITNTEEKKTTTRGIAKQNLASFFYFQKLVNNLSDQIDLTEQHQEELEYQIFLKQEALEAIDKITYLTDFTKSQVSDLADTVQQQIVMLDTYDEFLKYIENNKKKRFLNELTELNFHRDMVFIHLEKLYKDRSCAEQKKMHMQKEYDDKRERWAYQIKRNPESSFQEQRFLFLRALDLAFDVNN